MPTATLDPSSVARNEKAILENLAALGSKAVQEDDLVFEGKKFILPAALGGNVGAAIQFLVDWQHRQDEVFRFSREFPYRPYDGAAAFSRAMKRVFGTSGIAKASQGMFGPQPPKMVSVPVGPTETLQVPWGKVDLVLLKATFQVGMIITQELGPITQIAVEAPLARRAEIEGFFAVVEDELRERSIYRGKAFEGIENPKFIDVGKIDPERVVYSHEVEAQLDTNLWSLLRYSDAMRANRIPLKRAVLVEGPFGTGKSLAGELTAKVAEQNGWTFILARPGRDDLNDALKMAQLYSPAVVWFEDLDVIAKGKDDVQISQLLDAMDGITAKGKEIVAGFTTNYAASIQKGVLRPGRLDAVIHIGPMGDSEVERLCKIAIPADRQGDIDYGDVCSNLDSETLRLPAFVHEIVKRAMAYSIARNEGTLGLITTTDLVYATIGLGNQVRLMDEAAEGVKIPDLNRALGRAVAGGLVGTKLTDDYHDTVVVFSEVGADV